MLNVSNSRRNFIKQSAVVASGSMLLPSFLRAAPSGEHPQRRLIVIQLSGGNDGLNTIIPFRNEILQEARPTILHNSKELISVSDEFACNASMKGFVNIYDQGDVCILNGVGYPNPNRSHFRSMDIWHSASASNVYINTGWLGRYLDSECSDEAPITAVEMGDRLSLALKGDQKKGVSLKSVTQYYNYAKSMEVEVGHDVDNQLVDFLYKTKSDVRSTAHYLYEKKKISKSKKNYPQTQFANQLKEIAEMINSGVSSPIYYASLSGFDTHNAQQGRQGKLLGIYSNALKVFVDDLKASGKWDETLILTFSEFGRRVRENASKGTDHGKANNVFVMGGKLKHKGFYNDLPSLEDLDDGDLKYTIDFRSIYASILDQWMNVHSRTILGGDLPRLDFI
ncbi:MAG: DUF1501 domain-containing protein [Cyclobacteriaceae bacterium]